MGEQGRRWRFGKVASLLRPLTLDQLNSGAYDRYRRTALGHLRHRSKHQGGPFPRSVSCTCLSSALLTNSTESIAAPSWVRNCSIASFIGDGRSPHQLIA